MRTHVHSMPEQRCSPRRPVYAAGRISTATAPGSDHIAWVKDINRSGLCLFTRYHLEVGTLVQISLESDPLTRGLPRQYSGTVVRVQEFGAQAALAIAVRFDERTSEGDLS
jgi:hypothetical protein